MKHLITTVHLVIPIPKDEENIANEAGYGADKVSEFLTGNLEYNGLIRDWGYTHTHKNVIVDFEGYHEGDFLPHLEPKT